ncbi:CubicO group peptidase, beta-lactamase class C family [Chitinophaga eiseniae]|uniref:CubicO group peptidase, beta-lactamase class C family n=1 Tax=Chitinophaga eiseniae TaxID=634771 RepID=A0A1T4T5I4_9BACT|nr:serine hydrolase domain-containing protein [Chitinophaga eiseniae]SKA35764.1 CubicO group peptidase, beta-lactamase class C family [Chitinophaga eiseniae]
MEKGTNVLSCCTAIFSWLLLLVSLGAAAQAPATFTAGKKRINIQSFNREVEHVMQEMGVNGVSLAVISDGRLVYDHAYGYKASDRKERVNRETVFEACSVSKTFLSYAVYKVVDEGKLDLDKPMYQYLPNPSLEHDSRYKLITPRMILCHASGIENWKDFNDPNVLEIVSDPGKQFIYSGEGYEYLAKVLEGILHEPYESYMKKLVFDPMGLKHTFTTFKNGLPDNYATGYTALGKKIDKWKNAEPVPAGGINTTAYDYALFLTSMFDGKHLSRERINEVLQPLTVLIPGDTTWFYGPGFEVQYHGKDTIVLHGGDNPGFESFVCYSITNRSGLALFTNSERGRAMVKKLSSMSIGLDVVPTVGSSIAEQYPSPVEELVKAYKQKRAAGFWQKVTELEKKGNGKLPEKTLTELGWIFFSADPPLAKRILEENVCDYPEAAGGRFLLGLLNENHGSYEEALKHFRKAEEMNFVLFPVAPEIKTCEQKLAKK